MRKGLIFVVLVSLLLFVACVPKEEVKAPPVAVEYAEIEAVNGEDLAEIDAFDVGDLDELDTLDEDLKELETLDI